MRMELKMGVLTIVKMSMYILLLLGKVGLRCYFCDKTVHTRSCRFAIQLFVSFPNFYTPKGYHDIAED